MTVSAMADRLEEIKARATDPTQSWDRGFRDDLVWLIAELEMTRRSLKVMIRQQGASRAERRAMSVYDSSAMSDQDLFDIWYAAWQIQNETDQYRHGKPDYDGTWDHVYELASSIADGIDKLRNGPA